MSRQAAGCSDSDNNAADFSTAAPSPRNSASPFNPCSGTPANQPIVPNCPGLAMAAGAAAATTLSATDADSIVTSAALGAGAPAGFSLGSVTAAPGDGGAASVVLHAAASVTAGNHTVTIVWSNNEAQSATCTVNVTVSGAASARIFDIQGSGSTSALAGQTVTTSGVVTALTNNGYFLQDPSGDGNPATSDGIFVFTGAAPTVAIGQMLQLTAKVAEFNTGAATNAVTAANPVTQLTDVSAQALARAGYVIAPTAAALPEAFAGEWERYEGMLVRVGGTLTVSQNHFLGRYGQLTLSAGGRLETPTSRHRPGSPEAAALADLNRRSSIVLDDATSQQNPNPIPYIGADGTVRAGDTLNGLVGVVDYGLSTDSNAGAADYRVRPTLAPAFARANPRPMPPAVGGNVKLASFNVLNYFTTLDDGAAGCLPSNTRSDCRGADSAAEFERQRAKIIEAIAAVDADAVGLMEVQNNGNTAVQNLAAGQTLSFRFDFLSNDPQAGDFAFVVIDGLQFRLGDLSGAGASAGAWSWQSDYASFSHRFASDGMHLLAFGVVDVGDFAASSALLVDLVQISAVPEADTAMLLGTGLGLIAWQRRRRRGADKAA